MSTRKEGGLSWEQKVDEQRTEVVNKIIAEMEMGGLNWLQSWAPVFSPVNAATQSQYRGGNRIHLAAIAAIRGFEDPRWCTFNQAKKSGWKIKKGAKSAIIEHWEIKSGSKEVVDESGDVDIEFFRYPKLSGIYRVFNAAEIEGLPARTVNEMPEDDITGLADKLIETSRCPVVEGSALSHADTACYVPAQDTVFVPGRNQFCSSGEFLRTLLHEMAHSTSVPLDRSVANVFGTKDYAFEELVAELGSAFAASSLSAPFPTADENSPFVKNHAAYIQSWLRALNDDKSQLFKAASQASDAADYIVDRYKAGKARAA